MKPYCGFCRKEVGYYINQDGVVYCNTCESIIGEAEMETKIKDIKVYASNKIGGENAE